MNFTNYTELQSAISDELNRNDLDSAVAGFIRLMESQTERQLRVREMVASNSLFAIGNETEPLPTDLLEVRSFSLNADPITPLEFLTIEALEDYKRMNAGVGRPTKFTVIGENFKFSQLPDTSYTATLIYYQSIPRLSNSQTTNWLLTKHPDIYFYGALLNSAPYLKEDPRISVWAQFYQSAVDALNTADQRAQTAASGLKSTARVF